jgi:C-terminal processing protease CtpA/Prc
MDKAEKRGVWMLVLTAAVILGTLGYSHWHKPVIIKRGPEPPKETVGVGLYLGRNPKTHKFEVRRVFPNSPAQLAGVTPGLILNKVAGVDAESLNIKALSKLLSGPVGSSVTIELMDTNGAVTQVQIIRAKFVNQSAPVSKN